MASWERAPAPFSIHFRPHGGGSRYCVAAQLSHLAAHFDKAPEVTFLQLQHDPQP